MHAESRNLQLAATDEGTDLLYGPRIPTGLGGGGKLGTLGTPLPEDMMATKIT